jgi:hypothetical protein
VPSEGREGREGAPGGLGRGEARLQPLCEDGVDRLDVDAVEVVLAPVVVRGRLELRHLAALAVDRPPKTLAVHDLHAEIAAQLVAQLVLPRARRVGWGRVEGGAGWRVGQGGGWSRVEGGAG